MAPSGQDDEFAVPSAPAKGNKHIRSRSQGRELSDQQKRKQVTARTSLEDTIENLVDLPLSEELMSTRARADLQFHRKHARELRPMSSRNSINSLKDNPESLGQATPGLQAYQRPSSSGSSQNGFPFDQQQQPYDFTAVDPISHSTEYQSPPRPSTSSVNSNQSRSRIPVPANALSRSLPSSANGDTYFDTPEQPRSVSSKSHPAYDDENAAPRQSKPPPRSSSVKRNHNAPAIDARAERPLKRHESMSRSETFPQQQQQTSSSLAQQHRTPQQRNERTAGSQSATAKRQPVANGKSKDQPLGPKRAPNAANREPRAAPSKTPTQQPRARAVTGNAGTQKSFSNAIKTPPNPRKRAASAVGRDTTTPPRDKVQPDAPFVNDMSPIVYRSDHINKSKTSDSLAAMANNKRREQEGASSLDQARSWDDVVIPTVARQLHAQERLEAAVAADEAEREKAASSRKNGSPTRRPSRHGSLRNRKTSSTSKAEAASAPPPPEKEDTTSDQVEQLQLRPPEDELLPFVPQRRPSLGSQQPPPRLSTGTNGRKEIWEMPELASPGIAKETMQRKKSGGKTKQRPAYPKEEVPGPSEQDHGGGCCKCIIC